MIRPLSLVLALLLAACTAPQFPSTQPAAPLTPAKSPLPDHRPTILIVHGAWGGGWAFKDVDNRLSAQGWKVYRPTLTGQGEHVNLASPRINLSTHVQDIVNVLEWEDLHDVILVGHSYGGMVITAVADRVPSRIKQCIYLDALLPENGESVDSIFTDRITPVSPDGYMYPTWKVKPELPHDVPVSAACFSEKITLSHSPAASKIPTTYILTVDPGQQPADDKFYPCYRRAESYHWPTKIMSADHNPQWTHPAELVRLLNETALH